MTTMLELRAAMMSGNCFKAEERRQIRWLAPGMEAQRQVVLNAMGMMHDLSDRLRDCGEDDRWGGVQYCRVPTCPRCFMRLRAKETGKAIKRDFERATNQQLAFFTILLPLTARISDVDGIITAEKTRLRNMFARKRRADARWNAVHLVSWWEMDRTTPEELAEAKRNSGLFYEQIGAPLMAMPGRTLWRPHLHGIVHLGDMPAAVFAETLRGYGHGAAYQVDVQEFDPRRPVERNIQNVVRYALKFRIEADYKCLRGLSYAETEKAERKSDDDRNWWSPQDVRSYTEWLVPKGRKRSLRFVINKKESPVEANVGVSNVVEWEDVDRIRYEDIIQDTNWPMGGSEGFDSPQNDHDTVVSERCEAFAKSASVHGMTSAGASAQSQLRPHYAGWLG
ncbi:hypothetical protein [Aurantimonas coralicida]|uniref:hypothetical protein n=1 Tax=Aurantimonas coralicida TaxID=182270 RepID=UPI000462A14F|nr:hypothetical protein [Aurantimonas coralicida]